MGQIHIHIHTVSTLMYSPTPRANANPSNRFIHPTHAPHTPSHYHHYQVSSQWFVKMDGMAAQALSAVRSKEVTILPEQFEKVWCVVGLAFTC